MKSSTVFALIAAVTPVVAAVVFVQLWSAGAEVEPVDRRAASGGQVDTESNAPSSSKLKAYSGKWHSASEPDRRSSGSNASSQVRSGSRVDNEPASVASQIREIPARKSQQAESAAVAMTGNIGSLTFERQGSAGNALPNVKATRVSVMSDDGEVLEFSSENGQPVIVTSNLDDGFYKWEAVNQPDLNPRVREELSAAREAGDFQAERELKRAYRKQGLLPSEEEVEANVQSGTFRVLNGQVVSKDITED